METCPSNISYKVLNQLLTYVVKDKQENKTKLESLNMIKLN